MMNAADALKDVPEQGPEPTLDCVRTNFEDVECSPPGALPDGATTSPRPQRDAPFLRIGNAMRRSG